MNLLSPADSIYLSLWVVELIDPVACVLGIPCKVQVSARVAGTHFVLKSCRCWSGS